MNTELLGYLAYAAILVAMSAMLIAGWRALTGRDQVGNLVGIALIAFALALALATAADLALVRW